MAVTQSHRYIAIATALGPDVLEITRFNYSEQLGRPFQMQVDMVSEEGNIKFDDVLGKNATVRLALPGGKDRYFNGFVSRFVQTRMEGRFAHYRAILVPWIWFLTRTADCRIFQQMSVPDVIKKVFRDHGFSDFKDALTGSYAKWDYCVQYRETDFNFVSRLMEQEGIYYFFDHTNGKNTLVMADAKSAHKPFPGYENINFRAEQTGLREEEYIFDWVVQREVQTGVYSIKDFNFETPKSALLAKAQVSQDYGFSKLEVFDYPGEFEVQDEAENHYAKVRIQELQAQVEVAQGRANARGIAAGWKFNLKGYPRKDQDREYLVTGVDIHVTGDKYASQGSLSGESFFSCEFTVIPTANPFRPARITPKPLIQGPQTAIVVGTSGEEIYTDKYGRVKLKFHWDRYGKADETASCWVRVSQEWAGKQWGAMYLPRVGQEVIVEFLEGDPDRPIVTGRVYNAEAMPPYALPANKTKSTLKSSSSKGGGGFNEIRFEDEKGKEQVFIHAEKNQDVRVKADSFEAIGNNRHLIIEKDQYELVKKNKHTEVKGNQSTKIVGDENLIVVGNDLTSITGNEHLTVKGDQARKIDGEKSTKIGKNLKEEVEQTASLKAGKDVLTKAGMNYAVDAGMAIHIKGGMTVVIEAGMQLSLKAGSNFIDIGPAGVSISGTPMVMINSGGAAGSGGGCSVLTADKPEAPDVPKEAKPADNASAGGVTSAAASPITTSPATPDSVTVPAMTPAAAVLIAAAKDAVPFCEECARALEDAIEAGEELPPAIVKIAWLDGSKDIELSGDGVQWVNLPQEDKWVDADHGVANKDRLSQKPKYKVTFSKPGAHSFKVRAASGDDNNIYSTAEKGRNANFKWMQEEKSYTTDADGTKVVESDFFTTCAGKDTFQLIAEDTYNNTPVETGWLETKRIVYAVVVKMRGVTMSIDLSGFKSEYKKHGIEIIELPAVEMSRLANIGPSEENTFKQNCKGAFDGSDGKKKMPYAVAIGLTEHLAVKNPNQLMELTGETVGPGAPPIEIPIQARGLRTGDGMDTRSLWKDLVPGEGWFVSATFVPDGGGRQQNIPESACTPLPEGASDCSSVRVDVTALPAGTGTIQLRVNVVDRMRMGLSFADGNMICICTKVWWGNVDATEQTSVAVHEMGHKVGMVCEGTGKQPDKVTTLYQNKGHVGNHCYFDLGELDSYSGVSGNKCVMYGSIGNAPPTEFCEKCLPAVRKMDLSPGWVG